MEPDLRVLFEQRLEQAACLINGCLRLRPPFLMGVNVAKVLLRFGELDAHAVVAAVPLDQPGADRRGAAVVRFRLAEPAGRLISVR